MSPREYIPGDTVFAKLKGYPWWPARVENDKDIPPKILKQKTKTKGTIYTVFFYGSRDYGFFGPDCVRPFDRATVERDLKAKKFKTKDLEIAIHQALDPSILKAEEEAEAAAAAAEEEEEEEEDEEEEEEEEEAEEEEEEEEGKRKKEEDGNNKSKRKDRKKPVAAAATVDKKKKPLPKKKPVKKVIKEEEEEEEEEEDEEEQVTNNNKRVRTTKKATPNNNNKRARLADNTESTSTNTNDRKKRRKSLSTEGEESTNNRNQRESSTISRKSEEPTTVVSNSNNTEKQGELEAFKKTPEYKRIYHIRHKLQKLVYEKKPGEIQKEDFVKVSQVVKEIEDSTMTYDLLRYTKIGKVVKFACSYDYGDDEYKINQRCQQLMKNWKSLIIPDSTSNRSTSVEHS